MTIPARAAVEPRLNGGGGLPNFEAIPPQVFFASEDMLLSTEKRELGREEEAGKWIKGGRAIDGGGGRG